MIRRTTITRVVILSLVLLFAFAAFSQDPTRYEEVVEKTLEHSLAIESEAPVIFAGSSSVERWTNWSNLFEQGKLLDHGFEGSQTSDLIYFANELMLTHKPSKIFIYEGDNDLAEGKSVDIVLADMKTLIHVIKRKLPDTRIYLISPKPSLARLELRPKYEELNYMLASLCPQKDITFINIWDEMIDEYGDVKEDLFIEDGYHMNEEGYKIWAHAIAPHLNL